jgi:DNA-binding Lrp family transcriptional regulator
MKAYILVKIRTGSIQEVVRNLQRINGITEANMTFGPYDAVAVIEAEDLKNLGRILDSNIQPIPGVIETLTCLAVEIS